MEDPIKLLYLVSAILFILGLKFLSGPKTARRGNILSAVGMGLAIIATFIIEKPSSGPINWMPILIGGAIGSLLGLVSAIKVKMTGMPQMVALFNGFGGATSFLVASLEFTSHPDSTITVITILLAVLIGGITFVGSLVAFAKLQELISGKPFLFPGQHIINLILILGALGVGGYALCASTGIPDWTLYVIGGISLFLGVLLVIPIGGADMPVIVSLLNSYSGTAVAMTGFALRNPALIVVGTLVGASGLILTAIMCKAMNRSLANVLFGGLGATAGAAPEMGSMTGSVTEGSVEEAVGYLTDAQSLIVVPGYGMAVAQAQHVIRELDQILQKKGCDVRYAVHPVAGRMPGHMNVLLAEANVPYDQLFDLDDINDDFSSTDVVMVIGANDVVNPAAQNTPGSPIFGMPVLKVWEAQAVIVLKRSMRAGFAGIDNELFVHPKTMMVFGDAKKTLTEFVQTIKQS